MFRASPWISYEPHQRQSSHPTIDSATPNSPSPTHDPHLTGGEMDAPEISTLREEEEETPPPDSAGGLSFSKFRVNLRLPQRAGQSSAAAAAAASGSVVGPPMGPQYPSRGATSLPDSDDEEEEDQLFDDDELAIVTETGRGPAGASSASMAGGGSRASTPSPRKQRGGSTARSRGRRGGAAGRGAPGRRGRPGREPPDAAAMMSTFELTKTDQPGPSPAQLLPPPSMMLDPPQVGAGPSTGDWSSNTPPKPPRKKPGPKKGSTLGPRGPRKSATKTAQSTPGRGTPALDDLPPESSFLIPAPPSIPSTPGPDQVPFPNAHLPPILPPDFTLDPTIPIPAYPLPTRSFPVQAPPKVPTGYATTHPIDTKRGPVRKWKMAQREIKGIAGGRWLARSWVGERDKDNRERDVVDPMRQLHIHPPIPGPVHPLSLSLSLSHSSPPPMSLSTSQWVPPDPADAFSRASSVKAEPPAHGFSDSENAPPPAHWPIPAPEDIRVPGSPRTRTSASPSPPREPL